MFRFEPTNPTCIVSYVEGVCQHLGIVEVHEIVNCDMECCKDPVRGCPFDYIPEIEHVD